MTSGGPTTPGGGAPPPAGLDDRPLREASAVRIAIPGRRTGRIHQVTVWFAYHDGFLYFLAHARDHGLGTDWYRNLIAAGTATVQAGRSRYRIRPEPFPAGLDPLRNTLELFERKYSLGAVTEWYVPTRRIPVRARVSPL